MSGAKEWANAPNVIQELEMIRTEDTTSFAEHQAHLEDHLRQVNATGRPMFVTSDGETQAVVLSPAAYERLTDEAELARSLAMLDQSQADIRAGRVQPAREAIAEIAAEFGLTLERKTTRV